MAALLAAAMAALVSSGSPKPAPPFFATAEKGLTFRVPAHATYCPLPSDWVGSDHGTVLFLTPPRACAKGAGYPSSSRGFVPAATPRIEVFYAYRLEDEPSAAPCRSELTARLFGHATPLCEKHVSGLYTYEATGRYCADSEIEVVFTLVTQPRRRDVDLAAFRRMLASARTCSSVWHSADASGRRDGPGSVIGVGARCPRAARFF